MTSPEKIFYVSARADDADLDRWLVSAHVRACRSSFPMTPAANDFTACDEHGAPSDACMCVYPMRRLILSVETGHELSVRAPTVFVVNCATVVSRL